MNLDRYFDMVPVIMAKMIREGRSDLLRAEQDDAKQDAYAAIIERADRYDPARYESADAYFALTIRGAILNHLKRQNRHRKGRVPISKAFRSRDFVQKTVCGLDGSTLGGQ